MSKWVICKDCGHIGDFHESVYFTGEPDEYGYLYTLQCSKCKSRQVILVSKPLKEEKT